MDDLFFWPIRFENSSNEFFLFFCKLFSISSIDYLHFVPIRWMPGSKPKGYSSHITILDSLEELRLSKVIHHSNSFEECISRLPCKYLIWLHPSVICWSCYSTLLAGNLYNRSFLELFEENILLLLDTLLKWASCHIFDLKKIYDGLLDGMHLFWLLVFQ